MKKYILSFALLLFLTTQTKAQNAVSGRCVTNAAAGPDTSVCPGNFVQLYASGGTQFSWSPSSSVDSANVADPMAFPFSTTTYTVTVTDSGCTPGTATVTITILPSPSAAFMTWSNDTMFCHSDSSDVSYQWYDGANLIPGATDTFIVITAPCNYSVVVKNRYGCSIATGLNILCGPPSASFIASKDTICQYDCVSFTGSDVCCVDNWQWTFQGADSASSTAENPQNICYSTIGSFSVKLLASSPAGSDSITKTIVVTQLPPSPQIGISGFGSDTLICSYDSSYVSYQWYRNNVLIPGGTNAILYPTDCFAYFYTVVVTNTIGCKAASLPLMCEGVQELLNNQVVSLSPNPATNLLTIHSASVHPNQAVTLSVMNILGEMIQEERTTWSNDISINIKDLPAGIYLLQLKSEGNSVVKKFIKE